MYTFADRIAFWLARDGFVIIERVGRFRDINGADLAFRDAQECERRS